ncbi:MAG: hypothetical protein K6G19_08775 [Lachnospiraceae bacterium]|nr:hypothetical protein [Lachnospiraceae bacterium]
MKKVNDEKLSNAMRKYLIGKELMNRMQKAEADYVQAVEAEDSDYIKNHKLNSKGKIAAALGEECHLSASTVISYGRYTEALERVKEKNEKLVQQILSGETYMTYEELKKISDVL